MAFDKTTDNKRTFFCAVHLVTVVETVCFSIALPTNGNTARAVRDQQALRVPSFRTTALELAHLIARFER